MTFNNYRILNKSTFRLTNTHFSTWFDPDLGNAIDDIIGCTPQLTSPCSCDISFISAEGVTVGSAKKGTFKVMEEVSLNY